MLSYHRGTTPGNKRQYQRHETYGCPHHRPQKVGLPFAHRQPRGSRPWISALPRAFPCRSKSSRAADIPLGSVPIGGRVYFRTPSQITPTLRQELSACIDPLIQLLPPKYRDAIKVVIR